MLVSNDLILKIVISVLNKFVISVSVVFIFYAIFPVLSAPDISNCKS